METVVLVIHLIVALAIIALVLLQRSEGGGLGIGGGGMGNFASARGTANALTRMTAICAAIFFVTSLTLGVLASRDTTVHTGILEDVAVKDVPAQAPVEGAGVIYTPPENMPKINVEVESEAANAPAADDPKDNISAPVEGVSVEKAADDVKGEAKPTPPSPATE